MKTMKPAARTKSRFRGLRIDPQALERGQPGALGRGGLVSVERSTSQGYRAVAVGVVLVFVLLGGRLWQLQVVRGESYYRKTAENFVKEIDLPATRGEIRDRNGKILVENRPSYNVYVTPRFFNDASLARLGKDLHLTDDQAAQIRARAAARRGLERMQQILAAEDITYDQKALIETDKEELPGVTVGARPRRAYPHGKVGAHFLGFMNQVNADELLTAKDKGYQPGDYIGRAGVERQWEDFLRGKDGFARIVVDAKGRQKTDVDPDLVASIIGGSMRKEPVAGDNVFLTIDMELQRTVEKALSRYPSAAAAVIDVHTGRVLALASHPGFDPNVLTGHLTRAEAQRLESDPFRPLIDKAVHENYFPGSTFKIVAALAALNDKQVTPEEQMICTSAYKLPGHTFHCMEVHKRLNLHTALVESCNIFFYHLGERLGMDRMARLAHDFGFGELTGIGLPSESPGFIPTKEWHEKQGGFRIGYTLNTAIGQGSTKATVLQVAAAYAALSIDGDLYQPQLVERIEAPSGAVIQAFPPKLRRHIEGTVEDYERIKRALCGVVNDEKGTAWKSHDASLPREVCGKTGTAQVRKTRKGNTQGWDTANDHSWFAAFGPSDDPQIAVAVLVEHGGLGGHVAAPVAMDIYREWFKRFTPRAAAAPGAPDDKSATATAAR